MLILKSQFGICWFIWTSTRENFLCQFANHKGADQPAHPHSYSAAKIDDHVYICFFVNIEITTLGLHIQQSGVVLKAIRYQLV